MKRGYFAMGALAVLILSAVASAQQAGDDVDVAKGFKITANGVVEIGDLTAEIHHFDKDWSPTEQHDAFTPAATATPATAPTSHIVRGSFDRAAGPFNLTEQVDAVDDGIKYSATVNSDKDLPTNDLSLVIALPVDTFGGKQITVDKEPVTLPQAAAKQGESMILGKDDAHEVVLTLPTGTLTITGNLSLYVQDNREWSDDHYDLRLHFSPNSGPIKESKLDVQMKWKPTAG